MTPLERVARLRQDWAKTTPAPWEAGEVFIWGRTSNAVVIKWAESPNGEADCALIVRLRNAAEAQLHQLRLVFTRHADGNYCRYCHEDWHCPDYRAALAVLDKLDPPGGDHA